MSNSANTTSADFTPYLTTQLASAVCLMILSPVTIISNVLLLLAIFKDPLKCFRASPTYFIVALALVDFIIGVLVEPFFIMTRTVRYITWSLKVNEPYKSLTFLGSMISYVGLKLSFVLVLGLIWSQFIAITYPHQYRSIVTTRRVLACIAFSCVYFTGFLLLQFVGVPRRALFQVDLHLHTTLISVFLMVASFMLLRSFRKFAKTSRRIGGTQNFETQDAHGHASETRSNRSSERQFTIVILLLSGILVLGSLPHIVLFHLRYYTTQETLQERLDSYTGITIANEMMFLKVALDAFIYAWRLTKYRRSLKIVLTCHTNQVGTESIEMKTMDNFTFQQRQSDSSASIQVQA